MLTQLKGVLFLHMPKWRERIEKIQNDILDNSNNNYIILCFLYYWACAVLVVTARIPTRLRRSKRNAKIYSILRALIDLFFFKTKYFQSYFFPSYKYSDFFSLASASFIFFSNFWNPLLLIPSYLKNNKNLLKQMCHEIYVEYKCHCCAPMSERINCNKPKQLEPVLTKSSHGGCAGRNNYEAVCCGITTSRRITLASTCGNCMF